MKKVSHRKYPFPPAGGTAGCKRRNEGTASDLVSQSLYPFPDPPRRLVCFLWKSKPERGAACNGTTTDLSLGQYEALQKTLQPHYSLTKGITNNLIVKTMHAAMAEIPLEMEYLPEDIRVRNHLSEYNFALKNMHFPESEENCIIARNRFVFDEFFFFLLSMQLSKENTQKLKK